MFPRMPRPRARLGLSLCLLASLFLLLVPSASATQPYTCVSNAFATGVSNFTRLDPVGPNLLYTDEHTTTFAANDPCGRGTGAEVYQGILFGDGDFRQVGFGTFTGAVKDETGVWRQGTGRYRAEIIGTQGAGALAFTGHMTLLGGTGTGELEGLHGTAVIEGDLTANPPVYRTTWRLHWDP